MVDDGRSYQNLKLQIFIFEVQSKLITWNIILHCKVKGSEMRELCVH